MTAHRSEAAQPAGTATRADRFRQYQVQSGEFRARAEALAKRSGLVSNLRGLSFAVLVVGIISAAASDDPRLGFAAAAVAGLAFMSLVVAHARILSKEDLAWRFFRVNENAAARARDEWHELPEEGSEFQSPEHPFSGDLDLFGPRSLFQFINVAHTSYGQASLARHLTATDHQLPIQERQAAVRELTPALAFRQELEAYTLRSPNPPGQQPHKVLALDLKPLIRWAEGAPEFLPRPLLVWGAWILPALSAGGFLASRLLGWPLLCWAVPVVLQIALTVSGGRHAAHVFAAVSSSPGAFARLRPTFNLIESTKFQAPLLSQLVTGLGTGERRASEQMRRFESVLSWFELRHNGMLYPFINALLLWDIHSVIAFERWQRESGHALARWLEALGEWEALSSLAGLSYDNPDFTFPEIAADPAVFEVRGLGHPLIPSRSRVPNDVVLGGSGSALLVTGSNMSGKSTLLRAMGLSAVLGLAGAAVCADRMRLSPLRVYTSMRISDSLSAGVSHFYAELKKLRAALLASDSSPAVFFLLDEILHGTNSEERQIGARWILAQLLEAGSTGAVSTHDLGLCALPPNLMNRVRTVHLRESVEGERMTFDYKVRPGPVSGGNALLLMRSLGLAVPVAASGAGRVGAEHS